MALLTLTRSGLIATVTLNRPEVHNAFNAELIEALHSTFCALAQQTDAVRVVVLAGVGRSFCAGADLQWMRASLGWSHAQNLADAEGLAAMYEAVNNLPQPLVARIQGPALGGGAGLVACCDIAIAAEEATLGFSEVRLGLVPAVIAQYVVPKIGVGHARALFVSGERITAMRAYELGLVHRVVSADVLDAEIERVSHDLLCCGPRAMAVSKLLAHAVATLPPDQARQHLIETIAAVRIGPEGQEGLRAFLEKRTPAWNGGIEGRNQKAESSEGI